MRCLAFAPTALIQRAAMVTGHQRFLLCRVRDAVCALSLSDVEETMRPLPVEPMAGMPPFVRGIAIVRGTPIPVVDAAVLLFGESESDVTRFVTLKVGSRRVALRVGAVLEIAAIPGDAVNELPPLLQQAGDDVIAAVGALDADLLFVLAATKLVTDDVWTLADGQRGAPA
jgi:purine-binding chemotaxis protein CheW